jgi:hypothetical protein
MEILRGLGVTQPSFWVPIVVIAVLIFIEAKFAKGLLILGVLIAVIALAAVLYVNMPKFSIDNGAATLDLKGKQYTISKDAKVISEQKDGKTKTILVSGTTRIELPFSKDFANKFIINKLKKEPK